MSIPWWVYLIGVAIIGFAIVIHMLPSYLARLDAQNKKRREDATTQDKNENS